MEVDCNPICRKGDEIGNSHLTEEEEEEKVSKFFALIRNYKEARDRQRIVTEKLRPREECDEDRKMLKKLRVGDQEPSWIPAFKWEDFTEKIQAELRHSPAVDLPVSNFDENNKIGHMQEDTDGSPPVEVDGNGLDLSLKI